MGINLRPGRTTAGAWASEDERETLVLLHDGTWFGVCGNEGRSCSDTEAGEWLAANGYDGACIPPDGLTKLPLMSWTVAWGAAPCREQTECPATFSPGKPITITYPACRRIPYSDHSKRVTHEVIVVSARETFAEPMEPAAFIRSRFKLRSRWMLIAWDIGVRRFRHFSAAATDRFSAPESLQIVCLKDGSQHQLIGRIFKATARDRRVMVLLLRRVAWRTPDLDIRVIAVDLRVGWWDCRDASADNRDDAKEARHPATELTVYTGKRFR